MIRRVLPAVGLFFLSPIIGELLLGAASIDVLGLLPVLALLYGGGSLLIREVVRRAGRGWCSILLLGAAYALVEEGLLDQMLFNPNYSDHYNMVTVTYLPVLGTGAYGLLSTLAVHAVWSVTVPIALVEALAPARSREPWLGRIGLPLTIALFMLGVVVVGWGTYADQHFMAPWPRLAGTAVVVAALVAAAFRIRRPVADRVDRGAPRPLVAGVAALVLTSAFMMVLQPSWWGVAAAVAIAVAALALGLYWSRARGWGVRHSFAVTAGATLTYAWVGFTQTPDSGSSGTINLIGHIILAVAAIALLCIAVVRVRAFRAAGGVAEATAPSSPEGGAAGPASGYRELFKTSAWSPDRDAPDQK